MKGKSLWVILEIGKNNVELNAMLTPKHISTSFFIIQCSWQFSIAAYCPPLTPHQDFFKICFCSAACEENLVCLYKVVVEFSPGFGWMAKPWFPILSTFPVSRVQFKQRYILWIQDCREVKRGIQRGERSNKEKSMNLP